MPSRLKRNQQSGQLKLLSFTRYRRLKHLDSGSVCDHLFHLTMLALVTLGLPGCHTKQPPVTPALVVGSYTYISKDPANRPSDHNLDHLVLYADGRYDLVEGGTTRPVSEKKGAWKIVPGTRPEVVLDHAGYPIDVEGNEVRLLIDLDVGIWWTKGE